MGGTHSKRQSSNAEGGGGGGALPLGLGVPGLAAGIGLGLGRNRRPCAPGTGSQAQPSTSEFSILDLANSLTHRFSVLSGLSFISFVSVPQPEVNKKPWCKISRKRWHTSTLQNEYAQCKTVWPVAQSEALFLPEFPVGFEDKIKLILLDEISRGAFGQVFHVKCASTSREYAMKVLSKSQVCSLDAVSQVKQEVMIQHVCSHHPFITPLTHFWQTRKLLIVMTEYIAYGELQQLWVSLGCFPEDLLTLYIAEIAVSIDFLHNAGVIYRDLKMENILLDSDGHIKLIDFGLAKWLTYGGRTKTICGTLQFMAPEILKGEEYGHSADWWSLGIIAYSLLMGHYPVTGCDDHTSMSKAVDKFPFDPPDNASPAMRSLLVGLLQKVPSARVHTLHQLQKEASYMKMDLDDIRDKKLSPRVLLEKYVDGRSRPSFVDFCGLTSTPKKSNSCFTSVIKEATQGTSSLMHSKGQGVLHKACTRRSISSPLLGSPLLHPGRLGHHDQMSNSGLPPAFSGGAIPILQSPLLRLATGQDTPSPRARRFQNTISEASLPTAVSPLLVNVRRRSKWQGSQVEPLKVNRFSRNNNSFKDVVVNTRPLQSVSGMNGIYSKSGECINSNDDANLTSRSADSICIIESSKGYEEDKLTQVPSVDGCLTKSVFRDEFFNDVMTSSSPKKSFENTRSPVRESYRLAVKKDHIGKNRLLNGSVISKADPLDEKFEEFPWISESLDT